MSFDSPVFLFLFLPIFLAIYYLSPRNLENAVLLLGSILFYFWGEPDFILYLLILLFINYIFSLLIEHYKGINANLAKRLLFLSIFINLAVLAFFKYRLFIFDNLFTFNGITGEVKKSLDLFNTQIPFLPLGISFVTFHAISYQIDIYRKEIKAQNSLFKMAIYFMMFPHLLAGPILRYHQIKKEIIQRGVNLENFVSAANRFIFGLAKKVLIADRLATVADEIFAIPPQHLEPSIAWLGILCFTLQIYFDFSAYSDMAISLAKMLGFNFPENFNYPYISTSIKEFWRRWHITLYKWFQDYLYIPLGGNRRSLIRNYLNIMIVFFLCGLWHGANWNFVIWGGLHGFFLILERIKNGAIINFLWKPLRHLYTIVVVMSGWVFFRTESLGEAINYFKTLLGLTHNHIIYRPIQYFISIDLLITICFALILSLPIYPLIVRLMLTLNPKLHTYKKVFSVTINGLKISYLIFLLTLSFIMIAVQTYRPFIYFKF